MVVRGAKMVPGLRQSHGTWRKWRKYDDLVVVSNEVIKLPEVKTEVKSCHTCVTCSITRLGRL